MTSAQIISKKLGIKLDYIDLTLRIMLNQITQVDFEYNKPGKITRNRAELLLQAARMANAAKI